MSSDEETVQVIAEVPKSVRDGAKDKLPYGGMSEEIRETLSRIAFGEELNQRSRLEARLEDLREDRDELYRERRELDAQIENIESQISSIEREVSQLSTQEERYEAKLESIEYRIRSEGGHLFPEHGEIKKVASEAQREPEGVIQDLRERNPDIPDRAFEELPIHATPDEKWDGFSDQETIDLDVEDREARYR